MKKPFLSLLAAMACGLSAMAGVNTIVVTSEGESTNIALDEKPVVTSNHDELVVATENATLTYSIDKGVTISFADVSGIEELVSSGQSVTFYLEGNVLKVYNLLPGSPVAVYGLDGIACFRGNADSEGNIEVSLDRHAGAAGVYIVKAANKSIKISKKQQ